MNRSVVIDCFPDSARHYVEAYAIVVIDVIRATTTAVTAVSLGRRCYPVPSIEEALPLAARLEDPLLAGELGGNMPYGFHLNNSPAQMVSRDFDLRRPLILLSSSGTKLIHKAAAAPAVYVACLRNVTATADHLAERHRRVALLGAGTRGEFREEDQIGCAWIAEKLVRRGYEAEDTRTAELIERWSGAPAEACAGGKSAQYLRDSQQTADLDFVIRHQDDLGSAFMLKHDEIVEIPR